MTAITLLSQQTRNVGPMLGQRRRPWMGGGAKALAPSPLCYEWEMGLKISTIQMLQIVIYPKNIQAPICCLIPGPK